jgi:SAM-dependent methyltransferase
MHPGSVAIGVDFSPHAVAAARLSGAEAVVGHGQVLPISSGWADALCCNFAIYYLPDLGAALREWWRVLQPGGRVVIAGPASDSNAELYAFHHAATGCEPTDADRMALGYVAGPVVDRLAGAGFGGIALHRFVNRVTFASADQFLEYWRSTSLFQRTPSEARLGAGNVSRLEIPALVTKRVTIAVATRT